MTKRRSKIDQSITEWVNSLSSEEYCRLIDIIDPLSDAQRAEFDAMSDDELLAELHI